MSSIEIRMHDSGATMLHDCGVAGLCMSLHELQRRYPLESQREGNLSWKLSCTSIYLEWHGQDFKALDWMLKQCFGVSNEGMVELIGLRPEQMYEHVKLAIHNGIINTFLQHNQLVESEGKGQAIVEIDDCVVETYYKKIKSYAHQNFAKQLCDKEGKLRDRVGIVSWLYPGLTVHHAAFSKQTKFEETAENTFSLLFAPIVCGYFALKASLVVAKANYVLVIPEIGNSSDFADSYWRIGRLPYDFFSANSTSNAGLKFLAYQDSIATRKKTTYRCHAICYGFAKWSAHQLSPIDKIDMKVLEKDLSSYQSFENKLSSFRSHNAKYKVLLSSPIWAFSIDNLARGKPWWFDVFSQFQKNRMSVKDLYLLGQVTEMFEQTNWDLSSAKLFIDACHEALRKIYAKIYDRASGNEVARIDRKNQQILSLLRQCHSADRFRSFLADFFARAGRVQILEDNLEELLPITTGLVNWKISRDLFLIAMASYKGTKNDEKII